jgi:hypothetical protein
MDNQVILVTAMAEQCRNRIKIVDLDPNNLPKALSPAHLSWMCRQIVKNAEHWPLTKLHRWIGFVESGMLANRIVDLNEFRKMFDDVKLAFGKPSEDLIDHLDVESSFELDLGGQG